MPGRWLLGAGIATYMAQVEEIRSIERATADDIREIKRLREEAAEWLQAQGIDQWDVDHHPPSEFYLRRIEAGTSWIMRVDGQTVGTVTVQWADPDTWGDEAGNAGYILGLIVDRRFAGLGFGAEFMDWAESHIIESGRSIARLDCVSSNARIRRYYESRGYHYVGDKDFPDLPWAHSVARYEKPLTDGGAGLGPAV